MSLVLEDYQKKTWPKIVEKEKIALWVDMGLGKTVITLKALSKMHKEGTVIKTLVVAPLRVACNVWPEEITKFSEFSNLDYTLIRGDSKKRIELLKKHSSISIINIEMLTWLVEKWQWDFDCVIIDESSMFKSHSSKRFKSLKKVLPFIKRCVQLTGTPISLGTDAANGLLDLWPQIYILDNGKALGKNITAYRRNFFFSNYMGYTYTLRPGAKDEIKSRVSDLIVRLDNADYSKLKSETYTDLYVKLPDATKKQYDELKNKLIIELSKQIVEAPQAATLSTKLSQISNGAVYDADKNTVVLHDKKLDVLESVLNECGNVLLAYKFKSDYERIKKRFKFAENISSKKAYEKWNAKKIKLLCCHPKSAGHGLNLQNGGNVIVWFGLTWSLEEYQQFNARLQRKGQKNSVFIYHIIADTQIERKIAFCLTNKKALQKEILKISQ